MKKTAKKLMLYQFNDYRGIEQKLEKMAIKGLFLEKVGTSLWTFRKGEPKKLRYTVTYFSEGSIFNPTHTENQQTYFEYAKQSGWQFVTELNQMQIFCSEEENPVPFETDEVEKLSNIKKCMKKGYVPSALLMIFVFSLMIAMQFYSLSRNPIDFLSDNIRLFPLAVIVPMVIYQICLLVAYYIWCKKSEKSTSLGGGCIEKTGKMQRIADIFFLVYTFGMFFLLLLDLARDSNWFILVFSLLQMPILICAFKGSIYFLKKKKVAAKINRVVSIIIILAVSLAYASLIIAVISNFSSFNNGKPYRTVDWQLSTTESREYKLYNDDIPLTCENLYGITEYEYFSYEADIDRSIFLAKRQYRQYSLPEKDSPPSLEYTIIEPNFDFVYEIAKNELRTLRPFLDLGVYVNQIDNDIFGTKEAYQFYYDGIDANGEYILCFENKIVLLNMEEAATEEQIAIIREKLHF